MDNHYAKFEYKDMNAIGVTDYTNLTPHLQCVDNQYAKVEYKDMNTVGVPDYTN